MRSGRYDHRAQRSVLQWGDRESVDRSASETGQRDAHGAAMRHQDQLTRGGRGDEPIEIRLYAVEDVGPALAALDPVPRLAPEIDRRLADVGVEPAACDAEVALAQLRLFDHRK